MSKVCDRVGKTCSGPIEFYITERNGTGIKLTSLPKGRRRLSEAEAEEAATSSSILQSEEFLDIMENEINYRTFPPDWLVIKTKVDLDLAELTVEDETYVISKRPYASSFIYFIKVPEIDKYAKEVVNAFVLAIMVDRSEGEEKTPEGGETPPEGEAEGTEATGEAGLEGLEGLTL